MKKKLIYFAFSILAPFNTYAGGCYGPGCPIPPHCSPGYCVDDRNYCSPCIQKNLPLETPFSGNAEALQFEAYNGFLMVEPMVSKAAITCNAATSMGQAQIVISESKVVVSGAALETPRTFSNLSSQYDGHMTTLITAPGLSISFENWYGRIHNAKITTSFRSGLEYIEAVQVSQCSGSYTSDNACAVADTDCDSTFLEHR